MVAEFSETDEVPEADSISVAICPLIEHIFAVTADGSAERQRAMTEILTAAEKVRAALRQAPRLN
jgi:hypothetical protein